ncbi:class I SAM-dependent methyltransferase [Pseudarthrobacter phenanthrenivorans]|uniref:Class I SAM-dependent methyltransferase n=2 Tax=Pseudarthrobacter phenanthrenivorans TaxID=361575 RepID=A0A3B0G1T9_PSEPS|nr:class I SAM-dependent methyltransferase [Pseudarthrobacter phenanthrenivorans]
MKSWYDLHARSYAMRTWNLSDFPGLEADLNSFQAATLNGMPILDVGCGAGRDVEALAERGSSVIGVDLSLPLLRIARERCQNLPVELIHASALRLPLSSGSIGGIWSSGCLLHLTLSDIPLALKEMHRVLAVGAPLGISMKSGSGSENRDGRLFTFVEREQLQELLSDLFTVERITGPVRRDWFFALGYKH